MDKMTGFEKLNFLRKEFDLGKNPQIKYIFPQVGKSSPVDFQNEHDIMNNFDQDKVVKLSDTRK